MNNPEILVIDDEVQIRRLLEITLQSQDYDIKTAATAKEGIIAASSRPPQLIILDIGLPDESGHEVLKKLRDWYAGPIIILSVQNSEEDIVKALDNGATDYLVKPFRSAELLARIRSALKRSFAHKPATVIQCDSLQINLDTRTVKKNGETLKLTSTEYALLDLFVREEGKVLTHQYLLKTIWGPEFREETQYLRVFVGQLRKKIEDNPNKPEFIITESGVGYRFVLKNN